MERPYITQSTKIRILHRDNYTCQKCGFNKINTMLNVPHQFIDNFKMNDDMDLIWGIEQMERELSQVHSPASNIMNICTEVLKQVKLLKSER